MKKEKNSEKNKNAAYSSTEVGAMLEEIHGEIKIVAEGHTDLNRKIGDLEVEVHGAAERLKMVEITSRVTLDKVSRLDDRVSLLDKKVGQLDKELKETREELKGEIRGLGDRIVTVESKAG